MITVRSALKVFKDESYRLFALAILASLLWHLFWISTIKIVSNPDSMSPIKFSKVSFLGPLLGRDAIELQAKPKESSFLEKRYLAAVGRLLRQPAPETGQATGRYEEENDTYYLRDEDIVALVHDILSGEKPEPSFNEE